MGENSGIQWTTHTFNPWEGCQRVSPGCQHCYAETRNRRFAGDDSSKVLWGPTAPRRRTSPANWKKPLAWNRAAEAAGERHRVFCASLADVFERQPQLDEWRLDLFELIRQTPHLDWLLLTKRPEAVLPILERVRQLIQTSTPLDTWLANWRIYSRPPANVWLGTTVEDQQRADERIPALLEVPAEVRFLSCEPLLERVRLPFAPSNIPLINWVIIGGESGHGARPFALDWARDLVRQCRDAGNAPFVKQLGAVPCISLERLRTHGAFEHTMQQDPRPTAVPEGTVRAWLSDPAGGDMAEWPADLRVREFPTAPSKP